MTIPRFSIVIIICLCLFNTTAAVERMPIIAYMGVPDNRTNDANFSTLSECGFNVSLYPYGSLDNFVNACRTADKYGIKIIGSCPEMFKSPAKAANTLKKENGFMGYLIKDEPSMPDIKLCHNEIEQLKNYDKQHIFYVNLLPYYEDNQDWVYSIAKTKSYPEYLKAASATSCQMISFDFYPITTSGIRPTWYYNLEMIRKESLSSGKPFWGFALSVPHASYPQPTISSLRLQVYVNLAYGAQAIQYFTYWNSDEGGGDYHYLDAPIRGNGKKTKTWFIVKQMNQELNSIARLFYGAKIMSVKHLGIIPKGCSKQNTMPVNLSSLKIVSSKGALLSLFDKNGHRYMAVVNKNHWDEITLLIKAKNKTPKHVNKNLTEEDIKSLYSIPAGDILLFKLK